MKINVTKPTMPSFEEYCDEIKSIWDNSWLTNYGPKHKKLEEKLSELLMTQNVSLFTNGHLALEYLLSLYNFPKGSEIITTPFTFISTTNSIVRNGFVPIFCDVNNEDYTIDVNKIEPLITKKTVAILAVHVYGNICDVDSIDAIAKRHNLIVIYDAAHAFGVTYSGRSVAKFGDASMFSFHATKVFNTIEGGCICSKTIEEKIRLDEMKNFGISADEKCSYCGGNAKMNEFQASMGLCNLRHLEENIRRRKAIVERYICNLGGTKGIKVWMPQDNVVPNYSYFPVVFDGFKHNRNEIKNILAANDIGSRKYFYPLTSDFECYKGFRKNKTPVASHLADCILCLPLYPDMSLEDVDRICKIILES